MAGDTLKLAQFVGGDAQKWTMVDGHFSPFSEETLFLTTGDHDRSKLTLQLKVDGYKHQTLNVEYSDVGKALGLFCGLSGLPHPITSLSNQVIVIHYSENSAKTSHWKINWTSVEDICGEELSNDFGSIVSPNYPGTDVLFVCTIANISVLGPICIQYYVGTLSVYKQRVPRIFPTECPDQELNNKFDFK